MPLLALNHTKSIFADGYDKALVLQLFISVMTVKCRLSDLSKSKAKIITLSMERSQASSKS